MTEPFESFRPMLFGIAYRMLGSVMEAEDIVQEVYLRYQTVPSDQIRSMKRFLATIATRLSLNRLNSAQMQRENYSGPWIPEPIVTSGDDGDWLTPEAKVSEYESISMAFLVLLERLTPVERAVFLLREVFDYDYCEIAQIVDKREVACRQIFSRAKKHIASNRPRYEARPNVHRELVMSFIEAVELGEIGGIIELLAEDVSLYTDGGGKRYGAATRPIHGREHTALFVMGSLRFLPKDHAFAVQEINGQPGVVVRDDLGSALGVLSLDVNDDRVCVVRYIGNPDKLKHL